MINRPLPRQRLYDATHIRNVVETFSLVYLSQYNGEGSYTRPLESFRRAWGLDDISTFARGVDARPAFCVGFWDAPNNNRMTVAIEGVTGLGQLTVFMQGPNGVPATGLDGHVYSAFLAHANAIETALMAHGRFTTMLNIPGTSLTFSGFSLGGAVADILARKFKTAFPDRQILLSKFAAPRVGNARYRDFSVQPDSQSNIYHGLDRMDLLPYITGRQLELAAIPWARVFTEYAQNRPFERYHTNGSRMHTHNEDSYAAYIAACCPVTALPGGISPSTWLPFHNQNAYRLMIANLAQEWSERNADLLDRFRYLEFPGENLWQTRYRPGTIDWTTLNGFETPPPADAVIPEEPALDAIRVRQAAEPVMQQIPVQPELPNARGQRSPTGAWRPRRVRDF